MKNAMLALSILASCMILSACSSIGEKSIEYSNNVTVESAKTLEASLSGSEWLYTWRGREYKVQFNENGTVGALDSWKDVKWYVSGENNAVLDAGNTQMLLSFNTDLTAFQTIDWDGELSSGIRAVE